MKRKERVSMLSKAKRKFKDQGFDVRISEYGQEHFHPDIGEYWLPEHLVVNGDLSDFQNLGIMSSIMDDENLKIHKRGKITFADKVEDGYARIVVDHSKF